MSSVPKGRFPTRYNSKNNPKNRTSNAANQAFLDGCRSVVIDMLQIASSRAERQDAGRRNTAAKWIEFLKAEGPAPIERSIINPSAKAWRSLSAFLRTDKRLESANHVSKSYNDQQMLKDLLHSYAELTSDCSSIRVQINKLLHVIDDSSTAPPSLERTEAIRAIRGLVRIHDEQAREKRKMLNRRLLDLRKQLLELPQKPGQESATGLNEFSSLGTVFPLYAATARQLGESLAVVVLRANHNLESGNKRELGDLLSGIFKREADYLAASTCGMIIVVLIDTPERSIKRLLEQLFKSVRASLSGVSLEVAISFHAHGLLNQDALDPDKVDFCALSSYDSD